MRLGTLVGKTRYLHFVLFLVSLLCYILSKCIWFASGYYFGSPAEGGNILSNIATLSFIMTLWLGIDVVSPDFLCNLRLSGGVFVYFIHRPLLDWCRAVLVPAFEGDGIELNALYVVLIAFYFPFCIALARALENRLPLFYSLITGGRR